MRGRAVHLATRFFNGLVPVELGVGDTEWAQQYLTMSERSLWDRYSERDKVHTVSVARAVERWARENGSAIKSYEATEAEMVAAALMHDIGKADAPLGLFGRVAATLAEAIAGTRMRRFGTRDDTLGAIARYCEYPQRGAELLRSAHSTRLVAAWAGEHHQPETTWTVPQELGQVLQRADNAQNL